MTLVQLETLEQIEKETGKSILQTFKWLAGSGIGGFLLLMMIYSKKIIDFSYIIFSGGDY